MNFSTFHKRIFLVAVFLGLVFGFHLTDVNAQNAPEVWMTWKASSYVPPDFAGKALPSDGTYVTASFEVVDGGRFANVSGKEIYWYLNDELIKSAMGEQFVSFRVLIRGTHELRVTVNDYSGGTLVKTIEIQGVRPEAVIAAAYPREVFSSSRVQVKALPYFFTTNDPKNLNFAWNVNGQKPTTSENIDFLDISLGGQTTEGYELDIRLSISHPNNFALVGSTEKILTFEK